MVILFKNLQEYRIFNYNQSIIIYNFIISRTDISIIFNHIYMRCFRGYIVTAPNRLIPDRNESVCVALHNLGPHRGIVINVTLFTYVPYSRWSPPAPGAFNKTLQSVAVYVPPNNQTYPSECTLRNGNRQHSTTVCTCTCTVNILFAVF